LGALLRVLSKKEKGVNRTRSLPISNPNEKTHAWQGGHTLSHQPRGTIMNADAVSRGKFKAREKINWKGIIEFNARWSSKRGKGPQPGEFYRPEEEAVDCKTLQRRAQAGPKVRRLSSISRGGRRKVVADLLFSSKKKRNIGEERNFL